MSASPWPILIKDHPNTKICEACEHVRVLGCGCFDCSKIDNKHRFYQMLVEGKCPVGKLGLYGEDDSL